MNNFFLSLIVAALLALIPLAALAMGWTGLLTIWLPYLAFLLFAGGFAYRIITWAKSPVPFHITTTCGQGKSLPWIKWNPLESPAGGWGVVGRMLLEVLFFRSLFRNSRAEIGYGRTSYTSAKWLWLFALIFHWSLLIILLRHLRFFIEPIAPWVNALSALDGFFEIGLPTLYLSNALILAGLTFLLLRRVVAPRIRYLSLFSDYLALLLIVAAAGTGMLMRYFFPVDLLAVKALALGWVTFTPAVPRELSPFFYIHLFYVAILLIWFPFSKLMHLGGVFLSPTRNLANDSRRVRHVNPWNAPVKVHTYEEYENDFRGQMKEAGLPVEKE